MDDHSVGEIAESYNISRQAVYDNIRRTEAMLEEYEEKLNLFEKFQQRQQVLKQLTDAIQNEASTMEDKLALVEQLKESD